MNPEPLVWRSPESMLPSPLKWDTRMVCQMVF